MTHKAFRPNDADLMLSAQKEIIHFKTLYELMTERCGSAEMKLLELGYRWNDEQGAYILDGGGES